jgi:hypothetical protein
MDKRWDEAGLDVGVELLLNDSGGVRGNLDAFLQIRSI